MSTFDGSRAAAEILDSLAVTVTEITPQTALRDPTMKFTLPLTYTVRMRRAGTDNPYKGRVFGEWITSEVKEPSDAEAQVSARWRMANGRTVGVLTYEGKNYSPLMPVRGRNAHFQDYGKQVTKFFKNAFDYSAVARLSKGNLKPFEHDPKFEVSFDQHKYTGLDARRRGIERILNSLIYVRGQFYSKCEDPLIHLTPKRGGLRDPFKVTITAPTKFWPYNRFMIHAWALSDHDKISDHYREWYGQEVDISKRGIEIVDPGAFTTDLEAKLLHQAVMALIYAFKPSVIGLMAREISNNDLGGRCSDAYEMLRENAASYQSFGDKPLDSADDISDLAGELLELFERKVGPINQLLGNNTLPAEVTSLRPYYSLVDLAATKARYDARPLELDSSFVGGAPIP